MISKMPCPFCGSTYACKVETKGGFRLRCPACDAQTGEALTDENLKAYWERRVVYFPETNKEIENER